MHTQKSLMGQQWTIV